MGIFSAYIVFFTPEKSSSIPLDGSSFHLPSMKCLFPLATSFREKQPFCPRKTRYRPISEGRFSSNPHNIKHFAWPDPYYTTIFVLSTIYYTTIISVTFGMCGYRKPKAEGNPSHAVFRYISLGQILQDKGPNTLENAYFFLL